MQLRDRIHPPRDGVERVAGLGLGRAGAVEPDGRGHGLQRVLHPVVDLLAQDLLVVQGALQVELTHDLPGHDLEQLALLGGQLARPVVEHAERADGMAAAGHQRRPGVEAHGRNRPAAKRVVGTAQVEQRVLDLEDLLRQDRMGTDRLLERGLARLHPETRLEPLPVLIDEADQSDRHLEQRGKQFHHLVEGRIGSAVERAKAAQLGKAFKLIIRFPCEYHCQKLPLFTGTCEALGRACRRHCLRHSSRQGSAKAIVPPVRRTRRQNRRVSDQFTHFL